MTTFNENLEYERSFKPVFNSLYEKLGFEVLNRNDNKFWDLEVLKDGKKYRIEEKVRRHDFGDILVETVQDTKTNSLGWFYYSKADLLVYGLDTDPSMVYIFSYKKLKDWIDGFLPMCKDIVSKDGWGNTINKAVPLVWISSKLYKKYVL